MRRLAIFDEGFVRAGFGLDLASPSALDPKTAALLQLGMSVTIGLSAVCWNGARPGRWRRARPRTRSPTYCWRSPRWRRVVSAAPGVATELEYDLETALGTR